MTAPLQLDFFHDPARAGRDLEQIHSRVPDGFISPLVNLLRDLPDPDQALNLFERLVTESNGQIIALFDQDRVLLHYVLAIFAESYWLGETLIQHPDLLESLHRDQKLERSLDREDYRERLARFRSRALENGASVLLAQFKKREYVRIALRDLLGIATLAQTTGEISALADVILEEALRHAEACMQERCGLPQDKGEQPRFAVVSLGKLGGNELNYSSDIDLLYIYAGEDGDAAELREYFIRQAQLLTDILCRATPEGPVFRIDLRLRPQGSEGEPAIALRHTLDYYARTAHDWEMQALIKARHSAGDPELTRRLVRGVQSRIYTEKLNFAAIETALHAREKIGARRRRSPLHTGAASIDVKLDRGGIRDIEFLVQCLQRVYGGKEKWLRSGGTLFSLQKLHDKGHISGKDFHELTHSYEFLRQVEHRLQLQRGQQVHRLPAHREQLEVLRRAMHLEDRDLLPELASRMAAVAAIYDRIIHRHRRREKAEAQTPEAPRAATVREMSFDQVLERLAQDSTKLHAIASRPDLALHTRRNLHRFLSSALTGAERCAPLLEKPQRLESALTLLEQSEYLTDILIRHPDVIRVLDEDEAEREFPALPEALHPADPMASLRRGFRKYAFAIGARDVLAPRSAFQSMRESSRIADLAIRLALQIAGGEHLLAVFALGRLGVCEFDIASDADLLFVRPADTDENQARTAAERLMHALAAYTREGSVFAVDARLRPHGDEGELVITPQQLERYLAEEAQPWEALSYTKLRFIAGREDLKPVTLASVWHRIVEIGAQPGFAAGVREMRTRLEKANRFPHSFKLARGGFYDIDFIASYLMLRHASLASGNVLDRLQYLQQAGALDPSTATQLEQAAILYRTADHVIRLVTGRARPELPEAEHARGAVEDLVGEILKTAKPRNLQGWLQETAETMRGIFENLVL